VSVEHYENFPVDDLADEGSAPPSLRLSELAAFRGELQRTVAGEPLSPRWHGLFQALGRAIAAHGWPLAPLEALLDAFEQDVRNPPYADRAALSQRPTLSGFDAPLLAARALAMRAEGRT
jgi:phytoene/squalene synthetase